MVALYGHARDGERFNDVGVNSALSQPFDVGELVSFAVENVDEALAYHLAFTLRIGNAAESLIEIILGVYANHIQTQTSVVFHHLAELVETQQTIVNEDAGEAVTDGFVEQYGRHGGVYAAAEGQHHIVVAEFGTQVSHCAFNKAVGRP